MRTSPAEKPQGVRLIDVDTYDVHVDLTNAKDPEFEYPVTTVRFSAAPRCETIDYITTASTPLSSTAPNLTWLLMSSTTHHHNLRAKTYSPSTVLPTTPAPAKVCTASPTPRRCVLYTQYEALRLPPVFPSLRAATPESSLQPHPAQGLGRQAQRRTRIPDRRPHRRLHRKVFSPTTTYITAIVAGEYFTAIPPTSPRARSIAVASPWSSTAASPIKPHFDYDHIFKVAKTIRTSSGPLRPLPVPQVRTGIRPRIQHRRNGGPGLKCTFTEDTSSSPAQPGTTSKAAPALSATKWHT